jgi:GAF domain-containing protein
MEGKFMFKKFSRQIETLDEQTQYFDEDWEEGHHALLDFYVKIMPVVVGAERCSIFIHDPEHEEIWLKAGTGVTEKEIAVSLDADSIVGDVITTGEHAIVKDLSPDKGIHKVIDEKTGFITRDILCVPIKSLDGKTITGAVELLNKKDGGAFNDKDQELLEEMAHYLQLTVESIFASTQAASVLKTVSTSISIVVRIVLWIVGLTVVAIIGRILWVGLRYSVS